jgi:hypothetical protein
MTACMCLSRKWRKPPNKLASLVRTKAGLQPAFFIEWDRRDEIS